MKNLLLPLAVLLSLFACQKNDFVSQTNFNETPEDLARLEEYLDLPPTFTSYQRELPLFLRIMGMSVRPADDAKATLGRVIFYDKNLSADYTISCASCHKQELAFSDDAKVSTGVYGYKGDRNSMALANVASFSAHYNHGSGLNPLLLWDQRAENVPVQSILAFLNDHEMGMTLPGVVKRIKEQPYYPALWKQVFGNFNVQENQVLDCLQEFVGAIGASNSKLDKALELANGNLNNIMADSLVAQIYFGNTSLNPSLDLSSLAAEEVAGRDIFVANCSKCHSPIRPIQEVFEACNGLDMNYADQGKGRLTGNPADNGVFKSPSLRNIALTAPYMHDGRFGTLEEVVRFYSEGVQPHPNLHPEMFHNGSANLHLTAAEKNNLIAFLHTMTDEHILKDERFSNPFKKQ